MATSEDTAKMQAEIAALKDTVATLQQKNAELQLLLEITAEHSDSINEELHNLTEHLQEHTQRLKTSNQIGQQITSVLDLEELLPQVVKAIQLQFDYCFAGIWLYDSERDVLVLRASACRDPSCKLLPGSLLPVGSKSIITTVYQTGEIYQSDDVTLDPNYLFVKELPETRSELALPLFTGAKRIGVLDIQSEEEAVFDHKDSTVLHTLSNQVAISIYNARLYAEVLQFNHELEDKVQERTSALQQAYEQLELLDRNKSDFIQIVSHELRTPLAVFDGYSQILIDIPAVKADDTLSQISSSMRSSSQRLKEIVNAMLEVAKIDNQTLELHYNSISLSSLLQQIRHGYQGVLAARQLTLDFKGLESLMPIEADIQSLKKVFINLINNAIKYTPDGGSIVILGELLQEKCDQELVSYVHLEICDTGIGIDAAFHELIFAKFYRTGEVALHSSGKTKFKGGGPGLGLPVAKGILEAHGGRIWVESPGYSEITCPGSRFHVVLPVASAKSSQSSLQEIIGSFNEEG